MTTRQDFSPVIPGFHPDPSICRVGEDFYLVCSSFEYAPGVPIFHSTDLRTWEQIGNVLDRPAQLNLAAAGASGGITAPTLRYHDGRFWMITTNLADGDWQLLVHALDPAGPWSDPIRLPGVRGIDPDLAWDEEGTCYLTYAGFGADGPAGIVQSVIDPMAGQVLTQRQPLWQGTGGKFPEGPHLYRIGDFWYLLLAEGGTERGHAVTIARGPSPSGPFQACPSNPLLTARGTDDPVQSTGHADLVERPDGSWAMAFHGVRARGSSPQWHVLGRETLIADVTWVDGWPRVDAAPTRTVESVSTEELQGTGLSSSWIAAGRFPVEVFTAVRGGWRLAASEPEGGSHPAFVGRRQEHLYAGVRTTIAVGDGVGGLSVRIDERHRLDLEVTSGRVRAVVQIGPVRQVLGHLAVEPGQDVVLEIRAVPCDGHFSSTATGPDQLVAGTVTGTGRQELGRVDGRYVSTEVAGGMTGRVFGLWCERGALLIRSFHYFGSDDPEDAVGQCQPDTSAVPTISED